MVTDEPNEFIVSEWLGFMNNAWNKFNQQAVRILYLKDDCNTDSCAEYLIVP